MTTPSPRRHRRGTGIVNGTAPRMTLRTARTIAGSSRKSRSVPDFSLGRPFAGRGPRSYQRSDDRIAGLRRVTNDRSERSVPVAQVAAAEVTAADAAPGLEAAKAEARDVVQDAAAAVEM